jgi:hypothetical protein
MEDLQQIQNKIYSVANELKSLLDFYVKRDSLAGNLVYQNLNNLQDIEDSDLEDLKHRYPKRFTTNKELYEAHEELSSAGSFDTLYLCNLQTDFEKATGEHIRLVPASEVCEEGGMDFSDHININIRRFFEDAIKYLDNKFDLESGLSDLLLEHAYFNCLDSGINYDIDDLKTWLDDNTKLSQEDKNVITSGFEVIT